MSRMHVEAEGAEELGAGRDGLGVPRMQRSRSSQTQDNSSSWRNRKRMGRQRKRTSQGWRYYAKDSRPCREPAIIAPEQNDYGQPLEGARWPQNEYTIHRYEHLTPTF